MSPSIQLLKLAAYASVILGLGSQFVVASEKDTIGLTDLLARKPGANGSDLRIAQVEAGTAYQPSPAVANQLASKFSFFDADSVYPTAAVYDPAKQSNHGNLVANNFYDSSTGVATDVSEI